MKTLISIILLTGLCLLIIWLFLNGIDKEVQYQEAQTQEWVDEFQAP